MRIRKPVIRQPHPLNDKEETIARRLLLNIKGSAPADVSQQAMMIRQHTMQPDGSSKWSHDTLGTKNWTRFQK
jgi:hypothetical protein